MAGTQVLVDVSGLDPSKVRGCLRFMHLTLRNAGFCITLDDDPEIAKELGPDTLSLSIDGPVAAFEHRLGPVREAVTSLYSALVEILGRKEAGLYRDRILRNILSECRRLPASAERVGRKLGAEVNMVPLPRDLSRLTSGDDTPRYVRLGAQALIMAVSLLHGRLADPALALITADWAAESYLRGALSSKQGFPQLLTDAQKKLGLDRDAIEALRKAHTARNHAQHRGEQCDLREAISLVKGISKALVRHLVGDPAITGGTVP